MAESQDKHKCLALIEDYHATLPNHKRDECFFGAVEAVESWKVKITPTGYEAGLAKFAANREEINKAIERAKEIRISGAAGKPSKCGPGSLTPNTWVHK
jgi:hypothetical protein